MKVCTQRPIQGRGRPLGRAWFSSFGAVLLGLTLVSLTASLRGAENFQWARRIPETVASNDTVRGIAVDGNGDIVILGELDGTLNFGPAGSLATAGARDMYVAKLDRLGNFIWVQRVGGTGNEYAYAPNGLAIGPGNTIYITGRFDSADLSVAGSATVAATGNVDIFIAMLDSTGAPQWVTHPTSAGGVSARGRGLCVDGAGNCYVMGHQNGNVTFPTLPLATTLSVTGTQSVFVAKLDIAGAVQWAVNCGGNGTTDGNAIALAPGGSDPYICGWTNSTNIAFAPLAGTLATTGGDDVMVAKLDGSNGDFLYAKLAGVTGANDQGYAICVDATGKAYLTGTFNNNAVFAPLAAVTTNGGASTDLFVAGLDAAGANFTFVAKAGASGTADNGRAILLDGGGNLAVVGDCTNNAAFGALPAVTVAGSSDAFIARLDPSGPTWLVAAAGGSTGADVGETVAQSGAATIFAGEYRATATFAGTPALTFGSNTDAFITKFGPVTKGVSVAQTGGGTTVTEGGATDTYYVVLDAQPSASVTITPTPSAGATVAPPTLTFTTANWSVPQVLTVTAVNDNFAQGSHTSTITHAATGGDVAYTGIGIASVLATINDDDAVGVTVTPGNPLTLNEGSVATTRSFSVKLTSQPMPAQVVQIDLSSDTVTGLTLDKANLVFTNANWNANQVVAVTVIDDQVAEANPHNSNVTFTVNNPATTAAEYDSLAIANLTYSVTENDTAGVTIVESGGNTAVTEGGATDSYTIALTSEPLNSVTITVTPDASTSISGGPFVFSTVNWATPQTVTVTAVNNGFADGNRTSTITHSAASVDPNYNAGLPVIANVSAAVTDNETPGITVSGAVHVLSETAPAATDAFSVVLDAQPPPGLVVVVDLTSDTVKGTTLSASQLTFTNANWNIAQPVTVTVVNDNINESDPHTSDISFTVNNGLTTANAFDSFAIPTQTWSITDNDPVGVTVTPGTLTLDEAAVGTTRSFNVHLDTQPQTAQVVQIDLGSDTVTGVTLDKANLTFTNANWSTDQTVTVTVVNDSTAEGTPHNSDVTLTLNNPATTANEYDSFAIANLTYAITDNDSVGVAVVESGGTTSVNEAGATSDTFTMALTSQPSNSVTIAFTTNTVNGVTASASLTFTTVNWATPQTVTVTAVDDSAIETNPHTDTVAFTLTSLDLAYNGLAVPAVTANIADNDAPTIILTLSGGANTVTEGGATDTFQVKLGSQPTVPDGTVTVTFSCATPGRVTFTPASYNFVRTGGDWNTDKTVTITAVDDLIAEGTQAYSISATASSATAPPSGYNGASSVSSVTVTDDDVAGVVASVPATVTEAAPTNNGTFNVHLNSQPTGPVTVTATSTNTVTGVTISSLPLVFTTVTYATDQAVAFSAVSDSVDEGATQNVTINLTCSGADATYNALAATPVTASITDDDTAGFQALGSGMSLDESRPGSTGSFTIRLNSQPAAGQVVVIDLAANAVQGVALSTSQLTFTNANWNLSQLVTVSVVDDNYFEGDHSDTVTRTVNAGLTTANEYDLLTLTSLTYPLYDNDVPGVQIASSSGKIDWDVAKTSTGAAGQTHATAIDRQGNIYLGGYITGATTIAGTTIPTNGSADNYLAKFAPDGALLWLRNYGGTSAERILDLAVDPSGNLYCTGQWQGTMAFSPLAPITAVGSFDLFVGRVDPSNGDFVWVSTAGDVAGSTIGWGLAADANGVYVTGETVGAPVWPGYGATPAAQGTDMFFAKLNPATGNFQWARIGGGPNTDHGSGICVGHDGTIFAVGYYNPVPGPVTIGPYPMGGVNQSGFLVALDTNGNFIGAQANNSTSSSVNPADVAVDQYNRVAVFGTFFADLDTGTTNLVSPSNAMYVAHYNFTGGGFTNTGAESLDESAGGTATRMVSDATGNLYLCASIFNSTITVPGLGSFGGGANSIFIAQCNSAGVFSWATAVSCTSSNTANSIARGLDGSLVIAGEMTGTAAFGPLNVVAPGGPARFARLCPKVATIEAGATDTYTVVLTSQPTATVTLTPAPDSQQNTAPSPLIFTTANWNTPQTVTATAVNDLVAETSPHLGLIGATVSSTDLDYSGIAGGRCGNQITDNDTPGVSTTETAASTDVTEGGATDTYSVVLISQPAQDVTITLGFDATQVSLSAASLTFTSANWATPQVVTVTAADDPVIETSPHTSTITQTATSLDPFYNGIAVASVTVNITDNDVAGVTVTESAGSTDVTEGGATDTYTLVLTAQPTLPVTVFISATLGQATTDLSSVVFTAATWNIPQTITVSAQDDLVDEVSPNTDTIVHATTSLDANFNGLTVASVVPNVTDDDVAGITVTQSAGSTDVVEGGANDTFTVQLDTQPVGNVSVSITPDGQTNTSAATLVFTVANWNLPQTITISAVNDLVAETSPHSSTITIGNTSGDPFYNAAGIIKIDTVTTATITANVTDNDLPAVQITPTGGSNDITEGGATDTYNVRLATQPTQDVTITLTPDTQANAAPLSLTFTAANWATDQTVTVTAVDDMVAEGTHSSTITHAATSLDGFYNAIAVPAAVFTITDNDFPKVTVTPTGSSTDVVEGGATDTYTVVLATQPTATVTVSVTPDAQETVDQATLTFDNTNWSTPQTITVTAVNDLVAEGTPHAGSITHGSASGDPFYGGLAVNPMPVSITDNDVAAIQVTQSAASTDVIEGGATDTFDVVLGTIPTATVTVTLATDGQTSVSPASLVFTPGTYNTPQTVTVTAVVETPTIVVGAASPPELALHTCVVTLTTASGDAFYNTNLVFTVDGATANTVTANVTDKSIKVLSPGYGQTAAIDGLPGSITRVAGTVTVTTLTPHYLTLGQVVTIAGVTDSTFDGFYPVTGTPTATSFTYAQPSLSDASSDSGAVTDNAPEVFNAGATRQLNWIANGGVANVVVRYSALGDFSDTVTVGTFAANSNPLAFTVPLIPAANARIRIVDAVTPLVFGESAPFSIVVPGLQMTAPNGGETFNMDDSQTVTWTSQGNIPTVNLEVSSQATFALATNGIQRSAGIVTATTASNHTYSVADQVIVEGVTNTTFNGVFTITSTSPNTFTYSQPGVDTISNGGTALVLVWSPIPALTGIPNTGSVNWTVETPATALTNLTRAANLVTVVTATPTGIKVGDSVLIKGVTDSSFNGTQTVSAVLSSTQFTYLQAGANTATTGGELHESSQTVRLRVSDPSQPAINDYSDDDFSILNPGIFLITPNGGETVNRKSTFLIQWLTVPSNTSVPLIDIDVSLDNGATWSVGTLKDTNGNVAQNLPNTGSFLWDVTESATPNAKIRVRNSAGGLGVGISVSPFTILGQFSVDQTLVTLDPVVKSSGFDPQFTPVQIFKLTTEEDWAIVSIDPLTSQFGDFQWLQVRQTDAGYPFYGAAPGQGTVGRSNPLHVGSNPAYLLGNIVTTAGGGADRTSNVVTITTQSAHGYAVGDRVFISNVNDNSFNSPAGSTYVIVSVPTTTTFTYAQAGPNATSESGESAVYPHGKTSGGALADEIEFQIAMNPGNLPEGDYVGLIRLRGLNTNAERLVVVRGTVTDAFRVHVPLINKNLISSDFQGTVKYEMLQNFRGTLPPFTAIVQNLSKLDQVTFAVNATTTVGSSPWLEISTATSGWQTSLPNSTTYPVPIEILSTNGAVRNTGTATIYTVASHNYKAGDTVTVKGVTDASFNGTFTITSISGNSFSYDQTGLPDATSDSGTASIGPSDLTFTVHINQSYLPTAPGVYSGLVQFFTATGETRQINVQVTVKSTTPTGKKNKCAIGAVDGGEATFEWLGLLSVALLAAWLARRRAAPTADPLA